MINFDNLKAKIKKHAYDFDVKRIQLAFEFAAHAHEGQKRFSGEPYITHPIEVAIKVLDFYPDEDMVVAALLHDVSEDTDRTLEDIEDVFGPTVSNLVRGLEKLSKVRSRIHEPEIENLRKMFVSMATDIRVILIKLCDRWHNMETLQYVRKEKQERIARETLNVYAPIASRLGIYKIKSALEDLCFKFLQPKMYDVIRSELELYASQNNNFIDKEKDLLHKWLTKQGFKVTVSARLKALFSIYKKLKRKGLSSIDSLYDVYAIRVVLPNEDELKLYELLGKIHQRWTPINKRFKDYVAVPKPNGYRSLHTSVVGLGPKDFNRPVEIQIRTQEMHDEAESGVASHWLYKDSKGSKHKNFDMQTNWIDALNTFQSTADNSELMQGLQMDMFNDRIFVLTPNGDVKDLPVGATPIDFAYNVHTDLGHHCVLAKVNSLVVSLDHELKNGDVVEIVTRKTSEPNQYWLTFLVTASARQKVKHWFKTRDFDKNIKTGREILNKYLLSFGKPILDSDLSVLKNFKGDRLTVNDREKLLEEIGLGKILAQSVLKNIYSFDEIISKTDDKKVEELKKIKEEKSLKNLVNSMIVCGLSEPNLTLSDCCDVKYLGPIIGYVTRDKGITVHSTICKNIKSMNPDRRVEVLWDKKIAKWFVDIEILLLDRPGFLRDFTEVISKVGLKIHDLNYQSVDENNKKLFLHSVEITNYDDLISLIRRISSIAGVTSVSKVN